MLSCKYKSGAKFETHASFYHGLPGSRDYSFPMDLSIVRSYSDTYNSVCARGTELYVMDSTM